MVWKLRQSPLVSEVLATPGNAGIAQIAKCVGPARSPKEYADIAEDHKIDLTVVGPEAPLVEGVVNEFHERGLRIFGPTREAARLEGSKIWAKDLMQRVGIPTASWRPFTDIKHALAHARLLDWRCVVKADGLASGKGTFVCESEEQVKNALDVLIRKRRYGTGPILIEEMLDGQEVSVFAITDGRYVMAFGAAQDHKRLRDHDEGPNTGGMGAYSPVEHMTVASEFAESCFTPIVRELATRGTPYVGFLYAGAIITDTGPKILEFNCRLGDPEAQVLLARFRGDLAQIFHSATDGTLHTLGPAEWTEEEALCVVLAAETYPESGSFGVPIYGLADASQMPSVRIFHAGTELDTETGQTVTNGGRILGVTGLGRTLEEARSHAYSAAEAITFEGSYRRHDIGTKAIGSVWQSRWGKPRDWDQRASASLVAIGQVAGELEGLLLSDQREIDRDRVRKLLDRLYEIRLMINPASPHGGGTHRDPLRRREVGEHAEALLAAMQQPSNWTAVDRAIRNAGDNGPATGSRANSPVAGNS